MKGLYIAAWSAAIYHISSMYDGSGLVLQYSPGERGTGERDICGGIARGRKCSIYYRIVAFMASYCRVCIITPLWEGAADAGNGRDGLCACIQQGIPSHITSMQSMGQGRWKWAA